MTPFTSSWLLSHRRQSRQWSEHGRTFGYTGGNGVQVGDAAARLCRIAAKRLRRDAGVGRHARERDTGERRDAGREWRGRDSCGQHLPDFPWVFEAGCRSFLESLLCTINMSADGIEIAQL